MAEHSVTDYRAFLDQVMAHDIQGPALASVTTDVAGNVVNGAKLMRLSAGDPDGMNDAIDAQIDRLLAACNGDARLALFNVTAALGSSLTALLGPRR